MPFYLKIISSILTLTFFLEVLEPSSGFVRRIENVEVSAVESAKLSASECHDEADDEKSCPDEEEGSDFTTSSSSILPALLFQDLVIDIKRHMVLLGINKANIFNHCLIYLELSRPPIFG